MRHVPGVSNSTWSDQLIESPFMQFEHSQGGRTGLTSNSNSTQRWAFKSQLLKYARAWLSCINKVCFDVLDYDCTTAGE